MPRYFDIVPLDFYNWCTNIIQMLINSMNNPFYPEILQKLDIKLVIRVMEFQNSQKD